MLSLLVLERRWCLGCGWSGIARKFPRVSTAAPVPPNVPIGAIAALLLLPVLGCQARIDPVAELFRDPSRWVDLSYSFDDKTIYWPTAQPFKLTKVADGMTPGGYYYSAANFSAAEHGGTHLDSPVHFAQGRHTTDQIPLARLIGPAVVIDVRAKAAANRDYRIDAQDLKEYEARQGRIPDGAIVLFRTGWGSRWPDRKAYLGTDATGPKAVPELHFPGIDTTAARWLVTDRRVDAVGIDTPSIDYGQSTTFDVHRILFDANIPAFENVANLERVPQAGAYVVALPMKIAGGTGGPLRIVAAVPTASPGSR
ncbi:MAG: cyclase family protein [Gemmatimonadetes bacterium]|nr:cyclase family protein [Gemmatimonadota bacterium]